jgi:hypothetical protein
MHSKRHLFDIFFSIAVLILLPIGFVAMRGYNSDSIYSLSQARDIIQFGSLSGWIYSAVPFTVPDVILSIPLALLHQNPYVFYIISSPVQIAIFIFLYSIYGSRVNQEKSWLAVFLATTIASVFLAFVGSMLLRDAYYSIVEPFFVFVHHGFAAVFAVIFFLFLTANDFSEVKRSPLIFSVLLGLMVASDFYFGLYFGLLLVSTLNAKNWKKVFIISTCFGMLSIAIFLLSWWLNPSLRLQVLNSGTPSEYDQLKVLFLLMGILVFPTASIMFLMYKKSCPIQLKNLYVALILTTLLIFFGGLIKDKYAFRYIAIAYPISIILLAQVILFLSEKNRFLLLLLSGALVTSLTLTSIFYRGHHSSHIYRTEISCLNKINLPHSNLVAQYWPAKIVFESTGRQFNLWQVDGNLQAFDWINNKKWETLYPDNGVVLLVLEGLSNGVTDKVKSQSDATLVCDGKILLVRGAVSEILPMSFK